MSASRRVHSHSLVEVPRDCALIDWDDDVAVASSSRGISLCLYGFHEQKESIIRAPSRTSSLEWTSLCLLRLL